jgi:hypothetical protein
VRLNITLDDSQMAQLDKLRDRTVNTAVAKALTFTAKDSQVALKAEVPGLFVLRRNWVVQGIRIKPANGGNLNAQVGSIDKYMERHVIGAGVQKHPAKALSIRAKRDSGGRLATGGILIKPYGSIGSAPTHTVVRRQLSRMDTQKKKTFQIKSKDGRILIVKRTTKKRTPLKTLAVLQNEVDVPKTWAFEATVVGVVKARFEGHFLRAVAFASK